MTGSRSVSASGVHPFGVLNRRLTLPLALLALTWAAACGGDGGTDPDPEPPPQPNRPPVAAGSIPAQTITAGENTTVSVAALFTDPDGDALTYTAVSSNPGVASVALSGTNMTITGVSAGNATVTVTARDPAGLSTAVIGNVTVMQPNRAPEAQVPVAPAQSGTVGDTLRLNVTPFFTDPDGDALTITAESSNTSVVSVSVTGSIVEAAALTVGTTTLTVTATDPGGLSASLAVPVTIEPNRPPEAIQSSLPPLSIRERDSEMVNLGSFFTDPNGDALTFTAESSNTGVATVSVSAATMTVTGVAAGTATVTVTATDPDGLTASLSGSVTVTERVNRAPMLTDTIRAVSATVGWSGTLDLEDETPLFVDPDGDDLTYSAESSNTGVAVVSVTGTVMEVSLEGVGTAVGTVTATDPGGLSASESFDITALPAAGAIFRDDFDDDASLDNWGVFGAQAVISDGVLQMTNDSTNSWGIAGRDQEPALTSWEIRARMGRTQTDSMRTALVFQPVDRGELGIELFRLEIGSNVLNFGGRTETVDFALAIFFTPEGGERGWYYLPADPFRGTSSAINDGVGEFTDVTIKAQDQAFRVLAGADTVFSTPVGAWRFESSLLEIDQVHLWTLDRAASNPGLFDWVEINGVETGSSSANADGERSIRLLPSDFTEDVGEVREASAVTGDGKPERVSLTPGGR